MRNACAAVLIGAATASAAWAQVPLPIDAGGGAAPAMTCTGVCADTHQRIMQRVSDRWMYMGADWRHWYFPKPASPEEALAMGFTVGEWQRTVEAAYGSCQCACVVMDHVCGGRYFSWVRWRLKRSEPVTYAEYLRGFQAGAGSWILMGAEQTTGTCGCCSVKPKPDPKEEPPGEIPPVPPGAAPENPAPIAGASATHLEPRKPQEQEEPPPRPGFTGAEMGGWRVPFAVSLQTGFGGVDGDQIDGSSVALGLDLKWSLDGPYFVAKYTALDADLDFEFEYKDLLLGWVRAEGTEDLTIHQVTLGAGYEVALAETVHAFSQLGVGRYFVGGADAVNGHVIGEVGGGARWNLTPGLALSATTGASVGSAKVHAGLGEGEIENTWVVLFGVELRL
ncbi:MAG: hypothetical protein HYY16_12405 [Planctomycetes bacterium]|nr:hypothetical protein [Planctomycetota bacterium]